MDDLSFFPPPPLLSLAMVAATGGASIADDLSSRLFASVAALDAAGSSDVSVLDDIQDLAALEATRAGACFVLARYARHVPHTTIALVTSDPLRAFRRAASLFYPDSAVPVPSFGRTGINGTAIVHADARLEMGVTIDPGAVIGPRVEIGAGTTIGAHSIIGTGVRIGRGCAIDCHVSIAHALIGDGVIIHAGVRIGQGGPNLTGGEGRLPHLGRVIIQNAAEIGANATIERGEIGDTIVGDGARIEALSIIRRDTLIDRLAMVERREADAPRVPSDLKMG